MAAEKRENPIKNIKTAAEEAAHAAIAPPHVRRIRAVLLQWILIALAAAFAILTVLVKLTRSLPIDLRITHAIQASHAPLFGAVMSVVSWAGNFPQVLLLM